MTCVLPLFPTGLPYDIQRSGGSGQDRGVLQVSCCELCVPGLPIISALMEREGERERERGREREGGGGGGRERERACSKKFIYFHSMICLISVRGRNVDKICSCPLMLPWVTVRT